MTAKEFKTRIQTFRFELMRHCDGNGIPLYSRPIELKVVVHYETWRGIVATFEQNDCFEVMNDRPFGCVIEQTVSVPVGELCVYKL